MTDLLCLLHRANDDSHNSDERSDVAERGRLIHECVLTHEHFATARYGAVKIGNDASIM